MAVDSESDDKLRGASKETLAEDKDNLANEEQDFTVVADCVESQVNRNAQLETLGERASESKKDNEAANGDDEPKGESQETPAEDKDTCAEAKKNDETVVDSVDSDAK